MYIIFIGFAKNIRFNQKFLGYFWRNDNTFNAN